MLPISSEYYCSVLNNINMVLFHKVAYVPPSMRNKVKPGATFKLSEDEPAQNAKVGQFEVLSILLKFEAHKRDMRYFAT